MDNTKSSVAVDIGNSRIKMLTTSGEEFSAEYLPGWAASAAEFILSQPPSMIGISSVSSVRCEQLLAAINAADNRIIHAADMLDSTAAIRWKHIRGAGFDRVLGLIGAAAIYKTPLITIDCGTAITINALDGSKSFCGGAIMPGLHTQAKSLAGSAEQLHEVDIRQRKIIAGINTNDAITAGILFGASGAVMNICRRIDRSIFGAPSIRILTGGHAEHIKFALDADFDIELHKNLVLKGILHLIAEHSLAQGN